MTIGAIKFVSLLCFLQKKFFAPPLCSWMRKRTDSHFFPHLYNLQVCYSVTQTVDLRLFYGTRSSSPYQLIWKFEFSSYLRRRYRHFYMNMNPRCMHFGLWLHIVCSVCCVRYYRLPWGLVCPYFRVGTLLSWKIRIRNHRNWGGRFWALFLLFVN